LLRLGWVDSALVDLTGGQADRLSWQDKKVKQSITDGSLWTLLLKYCESGFLLGCGSPVGASDSESDASNTGIVQSHAYSILKLQLVDEFQLIRLRNPWGRKEWTGDWSDNSPLWTKRLKDKVNFLAADDGAFWMSWQDFCINFDELYICRFFDKALWPNQGQFAGQFTAANAGGCMNHKTVTKNIQYALTTLELGSYELSLELVQEDTRGVQGKTVGEYPLIILELYENSGKPVSREVRGKMIANTGSPSQSLHIQATLDITQLNTVYTLLPCTYEPNIYTNYTMKWYCNKKLKIQQFQTQQSKAQLIEITIDQLANFTHETPKNQNYDKREEVTGIIGNGESELLSPLASAAPSNQLSVAATAVSFESLDFSRELTKKKSNQKTKKKMATARVADVVAVESPSAEHASSHDFEL
jgi:hypothetical protein